LARIRALLADLGDPQAHFASVLIGGTNGKGSTAATLAQIALAAGWRTGLFTSPHLSYFQERFVIDGAMVPAERLEVALARVRPPAEALGATFFEVVTALGCLLFAEAGVALGVMEVGLGGRFDATNALEPELSVVTNVALDHTRILGDTVEAIAFEKAGIMRKGKLCLSGAQGGALAVLRRQAREKGATLLAFGEELTITVAALGWAGVKVAVAGPRGAVTARSPLLGQHQGPNVGLAMAAAQALGIDADAICAGVAQTRWPGRLEPLPYQGRTVVLDGAHNPDAAARLAAAMRALEVAPLPLIVAASADKDVAAIARALDPVASWVIATRARLSPRAYDPFALAAHFTAPVTVAASPAEALACALKRSAPGETLLVAGSLYLVGELRPLLLGQPGERWERWQ
jgi:dihydrofolate synthase/folylpolyglutamate synthase